MITQGGTSITERVDVSRPPLLPPNFSWLPFWFRLLWVIPWYRFALSHRGDCKARSQSPPRAYITFTNLNPQTVLSWRLLQCLPLCARVVFYEIVRLSLQCYKRPYVILPTNLNAGGSIHFHMHQKIPTPKQHATFATMISSTFPTKNRPTKQNTFLLYVNMSTRYFFSAGCMFAFCPFIQ